MLHYKIKNVLVLVLEYFPKYLYLSTLQNNVLIFVLINFGCTRTQVHCLVLGPIPELERFYFKNKIKEHIYCLFNPIPPCFASKCLNLIG